MVPLMEPESDGGFAMVVASTTDSEGFPDAPRTLGPGLQSSSSSSSLSASGFSSPRHASPPSTLAPSPSPEHGKPALGTHASNDPAATTTDDGLRAQLPPCTNGDFILVTGGLGYIGSHTALELMKEGYNVIIVDNLSNSFGSVRWRIQSLATQYCESQGRPTPKLVVYELSCQSPAMRFLLELYSYPDEQETTDADMPSQGAPASSPCDGDGRRSRIAGVIHFAAYKSVEESINDPLGYYENNVCGLVGLFRLLAEFNIRRFVFSSSATVYGSKANSGEPMHEDDVIHHPIQAQAAPPPPREAMEESGGAAAAATTRMIEPGAVGLTCPYARTKYFSEAILADVAKSEPSRWRIVALRYFNPIGCDRSGLLGESPRAAPKNLFPALAQVVRGERAALAVFGRDWPTRDGTGVRDYVHVADVARGHILALRALAGAGAAPFRTYNLGSGTGTSVLEVVESVAAAVGGAATVPIKWEERRPGDVPTCVASTRRAEAELGWSPRESLAQSARDWWNFIRRMHTIPHAEKCG